MSVLASRVYSTTTDWPRVKVYETLWASLEWITYQNNSVINMTLQTAIYNYLDLGSTWVKILAEPFLFVGIPNFLHIIYYVVLV